MTDSLKNIMFWYKALERKWRTIIPTVLGFITAYLLGFTAPISEKTELIKAAEGNVVKMESLYKKSLKQSQNVPALEESFNEVRQRMAYFDRKAPSKVVIDKFLGEISMLASDAGVEIVSFTPDLTSALEEEKKSKDKKKKKKAPKPKSDLLSNIPEIYDVEAAPPPEEIIPRVLQHAIALKLKGQFGGVASFLDKLRRRDRIIHYPLIKFSRDNRKTNNNKSDPSPDVVTLTNVDVTLHFYQGVL